MKLIAPLSYQIATIEEREKVSNGCGPDWFPSWLHRSLDKVFGVSVREACAIHDWDYAYHSTKKIADERFLKNLKILAVESAKDRRMLYSRLAVAHIYYLMVFVFGYFNYKKGML